MIFFQGETPKNSLLTRLVFVPVLAFPLLLEILKGGNEMQKVTGNKEQKRILQQYMELSGQPTLRVVSKDTGIQLTRVFRLINGSQMRLDEYLVFRKKVQEKIKMECAFQALAQECEDELSLQTLFNLSRELRRALKQSRLKQENIKHLQIA